MKQNSELLKVWKKMSELWAEGYKLIVEGDNLCAKGSKLYVEGYKLKAEAKKIWVEGNKLQEKGFKPIVEGFRLWKEAVLKAYGNIKMEWKVNEARLLYECHLENGEVYGFDVLLSPGIVDVLDMFSNIY